MITEITTSTDLSIRSDSQVVMKLFENYDGLVITSVKGCESRASTVQTSTQVGGIDRLHDYRTPPKTITVEYALTEWGRANESARLKLNRAFPHGSWVTMSLLTNAGRRYEISGLVERIEQDSYTNNVVGAVYIICPYPFFVQTYGRPRPGISRNFVHGSYQVQFPIEREPDDKGRYVFEKTTETRGVVLYGDAPTRPRVDIEFQGVYTPITIHVSVGESLAMLDSKVLTALGVRNFGRGDKLRFYYDESSGLAEPVIEVVGQAVKKKVNPMAVTGSAYTKFPVSKPNQNMNWFVNFNPAVLPSAKIDIGGVVGYASI